MTEAAYRTGDSVLAVRSLSYGTPLGRPLIDNLAFTLRKGQIGLVTGPNGIGKSTLLGIILGAHKPLSGEAVTSVRRRHIGYLPQIQNKSFHVPLLLREVIDFARPGPLSPEWDEDLRHTQLLSPSQLGCAWNKASGGERQKSLVTMTLMSQSPLILLDEPLNHLDKVGEQQFASALAYATQVRQKTILIVSHGADLRDILGDTVVPIPLQTFAARGPR